MCTIIAVVCLAYLPITAAVAAHYDMPLLAESIRWVGFIGFTSFVLALGIMSRLEDGE
jgi:hypothetical protein